ncbi:MAG: M48 family metalloprotease, partial [Gemmatimonadaceae bacterium]
LRDVLPELLVLLVPGALAMLALWLFVLSLFRRAGVGGVLLALGARPPRADDLEEVQLGNLVAEMSIAAGVPPPRLMLLDGHGDNAAAVGSSMDDAAVVVSRRMLDELDRDQTQAVIGHLVGSVGNGDLKIALILLSVYQTFGLMQLLFNTAFGKESRRGVWRIIRYAVLPRPRSGGAAEEGAIAELLARSLTDSKDDLDRALDESNSPKRLARIRSYLRFPLVATVGMASITTQLAVMLSSMLLFGPAFAALWRTRRFLADAMAVQLTRNPTALASALDALGEQATLVRGGESVALLFTVRLQERSTLPAKTEFFDSYHPRITKRLNRLTRLGAQRWQRRPPQAAAEPPAGPSRTAPSAPRPKPSPVGTFLRGALVVVLSAIVVPLMVVAFALMLVALSMMMMLTLAFMTIMLAVTHALLAWLFGLAGAEFRR